MSKRTAFERVQAWWRARRQPSAPTPPAPRPTTPAPQPTPAPPPPVETERSNFLAGVIRRVGGRYCTPPGVNCTDCSGLVREEYWKATGREISGDSHLLYKTLPSVNSGKDLQPGDLVFWNTGYSHREGNDASHVGIYVGNGDVINALNETRGIVRTRLDGNYGGPYLGARRLPFAGEAAIPKAPARAVSAEDDFRALPALPASRFREILAGYPMAGEADAIHDALGGNPLALAQSWMESRYGQDANAQSTHNPLGLLSRPGKCGPIRTVRIAGVGSIDLLIFDSWAEAFAEWAYRMTDPDYKDGIYPQGASLGEFVRIYVAGPGPGYANGESAATVQHYLDETVARLNRYLGVAAAPEPAGGNPFPRPVLYSIDADGGRFALSGESVAALHTYRFPNRSGARPKYIVLHIQDGITTGSLDWWITGYVSGEKVQASANLMAQRDGSLLRVIADADGPWTNGDTCHPTSAAGSLLALGGNPNIWSLTIEGEGVAGQRFTEAQFRAICWQCAAWMLAYAIPLDHVLRHADINQCSRANCPGDENYQEIIRRLRAAGFA